MLNNGHTVIHMSNNRHIANVILFVHDPTKLFNSKLHLEISERTRTSGNQKLHKDMYIINQVNCAIVLPFLLTDVSTQKVLYELKNPEKYIS